MLYYTTVISELRNHVKILVGRDCITNTNLTQKLSTAISEISLFFVALTTATILHAVQSPQTFYDSCLSTGQMQRSIWGTTRDHYQLWNVVNRLKQETALVALYDSLTWHFRTFTLTVPHFLANAKFCHFFMFPNS